MKKADRFRLALLCLLLGLLLWWVTTSSRKLGEPTTAGAPAGTEHTQQHQFTQEPLDSTMRLSPITLMEAEKLVLRYPEDFINYPQDEASLAKARAEIAVARKIRNERIINTPGLTQQILMLLEREHRVNSDGVDSLVRALAMRKDFTEADLAPIKAELKRLLDTGVDDNSFGTNMYVAETVQLLKRFPSEENEDLALRVLTLYPDNAHSFTKMFATEALVEIGTSKSLIPLAEAEKVVKKTAGTIPGGSDAQILINIREAIKRIHERERK